MVANLFRISYNSIIEMTGNSFLLRGNDFLEMKLLICQEILTGKNFLWQESILYFYGSLGISRHIKKMDDSGHHPDIPGR